MAFSTTAKIIGYDGRNMVLIPEDSIDREMIQKQVNKAEITLYDGRECSAEQRKKIFAIIREISDWCGHDREDLRSYFTANFCEDNELEHFSLSPKSLKFASKSIARDFITYLIEFCFAWGVPTLDTMLNRTEDIGRYLYTCLEYKKCAICNADAEVHHVDAIGMGRNRNTIIHQGMRAVALCRKHHREAHNMGFKSFSSAYHIYGIRLDKYLCDMLKLGRKEIQNAVFKRDKQFLQLVDI